MTSSREGTETTAMFEVYRFPAQPQGTRSGAVSGSSTDPAESKPSHPGSTERMVRMSPCARGRRYRGRCDAPDHVLTTIRGRRTRAGESALADCVSIVLPPTRKRAIFYFTIAGVDFWWTVSFSIDRYIFFLFSSNVPNESRKMAILSEMIETK